MEDNAAQTKSFHFGPEGHDLSDVVLLVQGAEVHVNKMFLATRSPVFHRLFYGDFKEKDQSQVVIEADLLAFLHMMEILYYGTIKTSRRSFIYCKFREEKLCENAEIQQKIWTNSVNVLQLADRFHVFKLAANSLENLFLKNSCWRDKECFNEGVRQLIAMQYDMKDWKFKKQRRTKHTAIAGALQNLKPIKPQLSIDFKEFHWMFWGVERDDAEFYKERDEAV